MNAQEMETAVQLGLSIVILICNDASYGLIKWKQMQQFSPYAYTRFKNPDFIKFAQSFGAKGYKVKKTDDLAKILEQALNQEGVHVIDRPVDYSENVKLIEKLGATVCQL